MVASGVSVTLSSTPFKFRDPRLNGGCNYSMPGVITPRLGIIDRNTRYVKGGLELLDGGFGDRCRTGGVFTCVGSSLPDGSAGESSGMCQRSKDRKRRPPQ